MEANKETEKLLSPKRRSKGAERQKEEGGISGKDIAMFGAEMLPGVGEAMAVKRTSDALDEKDYLGAGIEATAGLLGIIPGVGDAAGKTLRATTKGLRKEKTETIPVFPKPERMFPEGERPKGGKYLNPITGDDLTGMNVPNANLKINPDGKPSFNVTNKNVDSVGTTGKGNTQIKTNLFKSKAGWKWKDSTVDTDNINTLISVTHKGKHYYTLETDFSKGVTLKNYPESKTEPKLRPTVQGQLEMGTPIGTISVRGVEHPVYDKVITFAEGGVVPMNRQMSMFEDGGLMDEGGTVDPVSGNDVPPGSTQEEVRDDIPAQLSEGEFVFPADVVRYIGLSNLMRMRQEAKMGLKMMEEMGQMGNSEEATMPDDLPFDINDLDMEDDDEYNTPQEFAVGGMPTPNPNTGVYYNPAATPTTGVAAAPTQAASQQFVQPAQPQQAAVPTMQAYQPAQVPTFEGFVGQNIPGVDFEYVDYTNEAGNVIKLRKSKTTGELLDPVPEGYTFVDPKATKTEEVTTTPTTPQTTSVREDELVDREDADERRRQAEIDKYGNTTNKIALADFFGEGKDYIYGVNYLEGFAPGIAGIGQVITGNIPDNAKIMLKNGDDEILLTGEEYKKFSSVVKAPGTDYSDIMDLMEEGRAKALAAKQKREVEKQKSSKEGKQKKAEDEKIREEEQAKRAEERGVRDERLARLARMEDTEARAIIAENLRKERDEKAAADLAAAQRVAAARAQDSYQQQDDEPPTSSSATEYSVDTGFQDFTDFGGSSGPMAKGGLASKPKPKAKKKMKKGGLASKK